MVIVTSLLLAAMSCPPPASEMLVGRWESHDTSKGGIGHVIDFRSDGSFVQSISVLVKLRYELHDNVLTVRDPAAGPGSQQPPPISIRFEGDTIVEEAPGAPSLRRDRIGAPDPSAQQIVGAWRYRHYTGAIAFERYTADGDLFFRLPMKSSAGCYAPDLTKHRVLLTPVNGQSSDLTFAADGAQLRIEAPGKPMTTYDLSAWGAWYDIDKIDFNPPAAQP